MALGLLKWLKETFSMKERKKSLLRHELCTKGKFILKRKEGFMNFCIKKKLILRTSGVKKRSFSTQEVDRKMIFP